MTNLHEIIKTANLKETYESFKTNLETLNNAGIIDKAIELDKEQAKTQIELEAKSTLIATIVKNITPDQLMALNDANALGPIAGAIIIFATLPMNHPKMSIAIGTIVAAATTIPGYIKMHEDLEFRKEDLELRKTEEEHQHEKAMMEHEENMAKLENEKIKAETELLKAQKEESK